MFLKGTQCTLQFKALSSFKIFKLYYPRYQTSSRSPRSLLGETLIMSGVLKCCLISFLFFPLSLLCVNAVVNSLLTSFKDFLLNLLFVVVVFYCTVCVHSQALESWKSDRIPHSKGFAPIRSQNKLSNHLSTCDIIFFLVDVHIFFFDASVFMTVGNYGYEK